MSDQFLGVKIYGGWKENLGGAKKNWPNKNVNKEGLYKIDIFVQMSYIFIQCPFNIKIAFNGLK